MPATIACLALLVLSSQAAVAATTTDPAGDPEFQGRGDVRDPDATDVRLVEGTLENGTLRLRMEVQGALPLDGDAEPDRRYTYLFLVAQGGGDAKLHGQVTVAATCQFHRGMADLGCQVTDGDATLRGIGQDGRNVTLRLTVAWSGEFRVGGAAHESLPNGTQRDILVQDFTANALPGQGPTDAPPQPPGSTPWWKTPWILLVVLVALVAAGWVGSRLAARREAEDAQHRDARRRRKR